MPCYMAWPGRGVKLSFASGSLWESLLCTHRMQAPLYSIHDSALYPNSVREGAINIFFESLQRPAGMEDGKMIDRLHLPSASQSIFDFFALSSPHFLAFVPGNRNSIHCQQTHLANKDGRGRHYKTRSLEDTRYHALLTDRHGE